MTIPTQMRVTVPRSRYRICLNAEFSVFFHSLISCSMASLVLLRLQGMQGTSTSLPVESSSIGCCSTKSRLDLFRSSAAMTYWRVCTECT